MKRTYSIKGMTCNGCVKTVTRLLSLVKGVQEVNVFLETESAEITSEAEVSTENLTLALKGFPYQVAEHHS